MTDKVGKMFIEAAKKKLIADIANAEAKIDLYATRSIGVGEHPEITEEIIKAAEQGAHDQEVLDFISERW